jgi:hypothetical protein
MSSKSQQQQQHIFSVLERVQALVKENPHRTRKVSPIEIRVDSDTQEGVDAPASAVGGLVPTPLEPPGPVALLLWKTDPEFRAGTAAIRRTILRDKIIAIHERVEAELRGVKWSRKKILEQLSAQQTAAVSPPMETPELDTGLCALFGYQKVVVDEANKKVRFFPADPRTWSKELPIWGATTGARAALHRQGEESMCVGLAKWLTDREEEGWKIDWPEADGTLEEIKGKMVQRGISVSNMIGKPKKADYAATLGRAEAVSHISGLCRA